MNVETVLNAAFCSYYPLETLPKEARQAQTSIIRSESNIPVQALDRNQFPDIATRSILAKQTGIQESRTQVSSVWHQVSSVMLPPEGMLEKNCPILDYHSH